MKREKNCGNSGHVLNLIFFFRKLFAGLRSLEELRMNRNGLKTIDIRAFIFTPNLKVAFLMNNELTLKSTLMSPTSFMLSPFHGSKNLEELYLSHNNVTNIFEDWTTSLRLKILDLSYNQLQVLRVSVGS